MTESIKFGPEWLRNSVANVSTSNNNSSLAPSSADITCRPVLSDHRYGREEMLSLCDKSTRLPDVLTRFRRLYVVDWQTPLALQPNTDDDRSSLGSSTTWGTSHIRPLMPGMGRGATGVIRGGSIERGRGRGRGLYHGSAGGYTRSTSLYDEEGRRTNLWLDRNGVGGGGDTTEWGGNGTSVSPRKEYSSRGMENWRKGTRDETGAPTTGGSGGGVGEVDWRSSSNGTREKWARSTSWRDGDASEPPQQQSSVSPPSVNQAKPTVPYKKTWGEEERDLPEWATESFDYGGTFDSSGAFHDASKDEAKKEIEQQPPTVLEEDSETPPEVNHAATEPQKFMDFNGGAAIDRMKEVADLVANLIMEDEPKDVKVAPAPALIDWFYLDPQGDTQGPFSAQDMSEWYKAGYFQESLMVRRSIDGAFMPLGQLVKVYGRNAPFMQPQVMEAPNPPAFMFEKPQNFVEKPQVVFQPQPQPQHTANNWNMMTPEQQILLLNMRLAHQRPPAPPQPDSYRMSGDFYQPPPPPVVQQHQQQEIDPIQQLLMQLQKTGGHETQQQQQWMKQVVPEMLNHNSSVPVNNWNQPPQPQQAPISMWDMPSTAKMEQSMQPIQVQQQERTEAVAPLEPEREMMNGVMEHQQQQQQQQFQAAPVSKGNKKKQKEAPVVKETSTPPTKQQQTQPAKKKVNEKPREKKEERTTQPAAPAPWVGHQAPSGGASIAKIQKTEAQRRQEIQRERDLHKHVEPKPEKNDGLKWAAPPTARVKTLDEIQAEEQVQATAAQAKREAAKKEAATVVVNDAMIWNSTPHSMAWQQPKVWSGEQTSGSGFWEEPTLTTKPSNGAGSTKMLSKSQTMATITTNKKQTVAPPMTVKKPIPAKRPTGNGEKREKKDDNNNEFTSWCTRTLSQMNGEVDVPTFVSFLQDIESPFEVKDYIKMYLGETKDCAEFAKQFLERRSKQRNQQRLQNAHIDDMCSPAPAITPSVGGLSTEFQEVKGKNKKVKAKKVMKVIDGRSLLGFTATSASDRINVGDRDYGEI